MKCIIKVISKLLIILILTITILLARTQTVEAASFWDDMFEQANSFMQEGKSEAELEDGTSDVQTAEVITILFNTLMSLGSVISVGIGGALGIKFMTASAEDKAKVKESMVPYVVGTAVIFGAFAIWKIAIAVFSQI